MNLKTLIAVAAFSMALASTAYSQDKAAASTATPDSATKPSSSQTQTVRPPTATPPVNMNAELAEIRKLAEAYKASPNDELKAKIKEKLASSFDTMVKMREAQIASETANLERMKQNKDAEVEKMLSRLLNPPPAPSAPSAATPASAAVKSTVPVTGIASSSVKPAASPATPASVSNP